MTFFVFLVDGNIAFFRKPFLPLSGRGGLSSGKMKFLVQFAIRCECKRPSPFLDIEKGARWSDGCERNGEGEDRKSEARGQNVSGEPNVICDTGDCTAAFFPVFSQPRFASLATKLDISRAIKSNLLRKRPVPLARVISMASTLEWSVGERANNTADFKRFYVHAGELYFQHLLLLLLLPFALHFRATLISGCVIHREINVLDPFRWKNLFLTTNWTHFYIEHFLNKVD